MVRLALIPFQRLHPCLHHSWAPEPSDSHKPVGLVDFGRHLLPVARILCPATFANAFLFDTLPRVCLGLGTCRHLFFGEQWRLALLAPPQGLPWDRHLSPPFFSAQWRLALLAPPQGLPWARHLPSPFFGVQWRLALLAPSQGLLWARHLPPPFFGAQWRLALLAPDSSSMAVGAWCPTGLAVAPSLVADGLGRLLPRQHRGEEPFLPALLRRCGVGLARRRSLWLPRRSGCLCRPLGSASLRGHTGAHPGSSTERLRLGERVCSSLRVLRLPVRILWRAVLVPALTRPQRGTEDFPHPLSRRCGVGAARRRPSHPFRFTMAEARQGPGGLLRAFSSVRRLRSRGPMPPAFPATRLALGGCARPVPRISRLPGSSGGVVAGAASDAHGGARAFARRVGINATRLVRALTSPVAFIPTK